MCGGQVNVVFFFFFSSRRRHTRCYRDWSSDVCSSDLDEGRDRRCLLVVLELDVSEAGVVVDDRVRIVVADGGPLLVGGAMAVAGDRVTGSQEARVAADIHVQQIAGARPFIAVGRLLDRSRPPRDPGPLEHLPDRRMRTAGLAPTGADPLLQLGSEKPRRALRTTRAINQRLRPPTSV